MAITDYDRQAVIWAGEVAALTNFLYQAEALNAKAKQKAKEKGHALPSRTECLYPGMGKADGENLREMLSELTDKSRLYILGHGSAGAAPKFVSWDAKGLALLLKEHGLAHARLINFGSCVLARDHEADNDNWLLKAANSFAAEFHRQLKEQKPALMTELRAYLWKMRVNTGMKSFAAGAKIATLSPLDQVDEKDWLHQPNANKIAFYWENGEQKRRIVNKSGVLPVVPV
jgi:hypothetical protein